MNTFLNSFTFFKDLVLWFRHDFILQIYLMILFYNFFLCFSLIILFYDFFLYFSLIIFVPWISSIIFSNNFLLLFSSSDFILWFLRMLFNLVNFQKQKEIQQFKITHHWENILENIFKHWLYLTNKDKIYLFRDISL